MRVGIVCPYDWDVPGGVQAHVRDLSEALIRRGHEVSVLAPADDDADLPAYVVPAGRSVPVPYNGSVARLNFGVASTRRVRRWVREGGFDVMHVHEPTAPGLSLIACWAATGPIVATFHTSNTRSRAMTAASWMLQTALEKISARVAVSDAARQTLVEHLGGDAVVIPNGVHCAGFADPEPLPAAAIGADGPTDGTGRLLFLGRIDESRKGLDVLLDAMPLILDEFPDCRLLVVGPGDIEDVRNSMEPGLSAHVTFLGEVDDRDKVRAFHSADVYVAPNTGGESFGVVLLEAMASGTPVLASALEAFRVVLDGGRVGAMFPVGDAPALAAAAVELLGDPDLRARLSALGLVRAAAYDWDVVSREVLDVYESVTVSGTPVTEDLRGQVMGRWSRLGRGRDDSELSR